MDLFEKEYIESLGFKVVKDDGQYGEATSVMPKGMTVLQWNRDGASCTYLGEKLPDNAYFSIQKDGGTRYAFNGHVFSREDIEKTLELTW